MAPSTGAAVGFQHHAVPVDVKPHPPNLPLAISVSGGSPGTCSRAVGSPVEAFPEHHVRGPWGVAAGVGSNAGSYRLIREARLTYADSVTVERDDGRGGWNNGVWNVGITRQPQHADLTVEYGHAGALKGGFDGRPLLRDAGPRRSVSLGVQFVY